MYRRFAFEGDIHETLDCIPLTARRKLDLAQLKISLEGWQRLSRPERLALCHLPVDSEGELAVYCEVLAGFAASHDVPLLPLRIDSMAWRTSEVPEQLRARLSALDVHLENESWFALDEEVRYSLVKLADPKRNPAKLPRLLHELGLAPEPTEPLQPTRNICESNMVAPP